MESDDSNLAFDRADYADQSSKAQSCTSCKQPISGSYFEVSGSIVCESCRNRIQQLMERGSGVSRVGRALVAGFMAAALGAGIYFGISALTGYEIGLVAILVGFLVGKAVAWGSNYRGGLGFQLLAVFLTYTAIVTTYVPQIIHAFEQGAVFESAQSAAEYESMDVPPITVDELDQQPVEITDHFLGWVFLFVLAFALPFLSGFQNIMGLIIIGIALYEAWRFNKRNPIKFSGPFTLSTGTPPQSTSPST